MSDNDGPNIMEEEEEEEEVAAPASPGRDGEVDAETAVPSTPPVTSQHQTMSMSTVAATPTNNDGVGVGDGEEEEVVEGTPSSVAGTPAERSDARASLDGGRSGMSLGARSELTPLSALDDRGSARSSGTTRRSLLPRDDEEDGRRPPRRIPMEVVEEEDEDSCREREDRPRANVVEDDENDPTREEAVVWGTDVHVPTAEAAFRDFLRTFVSSRLSRRRNWPRENDDDDDDSVDSVDSEDDAVPYYLSRLRDAARGIAPRSPDDDDVHAASSSSSPTRHSLDVDCQHLHSHSPACRRLYHQLIKYPQEIVPLMDLVCHREHERLRDDDDDDVDGGAIVPVPLQVRPHNLRSVSNMRALDPEHVDTLVALKGMVVRTSPIVPDLRVGLFACSVCGRATEVAVDRGRIDEPTGRCPDCRASNAATLQHNRCDFADKQTVRLQETPDEVPAGETPAAVVALAYDDLVDGVRPGDRVEATGVLRAAPRRTNPRISRVRSVYKVYVDVIHFRRIGKEDRAGGSRNTNNTGTEGGTHADVGGQLSPERIRQIEALSRDPNIYEKLTASLAPSIWELDDVKKGVLCMLFGGNSRKVKKGTHTSGGGDGGGGNDDEDMNNPDNQEEDFSTHNNKLAKRGDINILLCGDPGTSKSQLLSYVHKLSPRGVYTSGKGSSAVGLTASVARDPETREIVLESGALVLSDLGICCIDEFDKMSEATRAVLHEAMEQQTVSVAKAGIVATLNARASILASANPVESRYNPHKSVVENVRLPPTLLSRFDLIYLVLDTPNADADRRLAKHLVGLYRDDPDAVEPPLDRDLLRDYVRHARETVHPELSDLAARELVRRYLELRRGGDGGARTISATPRQLESLVRLSEALARSRLSRVVERRDVDEATRLLRVATRAAATDPRTGRIDMDMIATGRSAAEREERERLGTTVRGLLNRRKGARLSVAEVRRQVREVTGGAEDASPEALAEVLRELEADGVLQLNERTQTILVRSRVTT